MFLYTMINECLSLLYFEYLEYYNTIKYIRTIYISPPKSSFSINFEFPQIRGFVLWIKTNPLKSSQSKLFDSFHSIIPFF